MEHAYNSFHYPKEKQETFCRFLAEHIGLNDKKLFSSFAFAHIELAIADNSLYSRYSSGGIFQISSCCLVKIRTIAVSDSVKSSAFVKKKDKVFIMFY